MLTMGCMNLEHGVSKLVTCSGELIVRRTGRSAENHPLSVEILGALLFMSV
jgi:hypothetical protein